MYAREIEHILFDCDLNDCALKLHTFLDQVQRLSIPLYDNLSNASRVQFLTYMLGRIDDDFTKLIDVISYPTFLIMCAKFINSLMQSQVT